MSVPLRCLCLRHRARCVTPGMRWPCRAAPPPASTAPATERLQRPRRWRRCPAPRPVPAVLAFVVASRASSASAACSRAFRLASIPAARRGHLSTLSSPPPVAPAASSDSATAHASAMRGTTHATHTRRLPRAPLPHALRVLLAAAGSTRLDAASPCLNVARRRDQFVRRRRVRLEVEEPQARVTACHARRRLLTRPTDQLW